VEAVVLGLASLAAPVVVSQRAAALGGEFDALPTVDGWRVSCRIPLRIGEGSANADSGSP
jgi:hypothetical protein